MNPETLGSSVPWWRSLGFRSGILIACLLLVVSGLHGVLLQYLLEDHFRERRIQDLRFEVEWMGRELAVRQPGTDPAHLLGQLERFVHRSTQILLDGEGKELARVPAEAEESTADLPRPSSLPLTPGEIWSGQDARGTPIALVRLPGNGEPRFLAGWSARPGPRPRRSGEGPGGRGRRPDPFPFGDPFVHRSLAILAGSGIAGFLAVALLLRRLDRLRAAVGRLAEGDLAARVEPGTDDEIGRLLLAFNTMAGKIETAQKELSEQDQSRRNLLADISHELRTPLAALLCHLELLFEVSSELSREQRDRLGAAIDEARAAGERVEDLLTLARSDLGELPLQRRPINLQRFLQELVDRYQPILATTGIEVETDFGEEIREVTADPRRLDQIFRNLIENARAAMREGGQLRLEVRDREPGRVEVAVKDTGPGIPADELAHLFERFRRGQGGREGGTGLGLAITRRLTEAHGGTCEVESRPGDGACFRVVLPLRGG